MSVTVKEKKEEIYNLKNTKVMMLIVLFLLSLTLFSWGILAQQGVMIGVGYLLLTLALAYVAVLPTSWKTYALLPFVSTGLFGIVLFGNAATLLLTLGGPLMLFAFLLRRVLSNRIKINLGGDTTIPFFFFSFLSLAFGGLFALSALSATVREKLPNVINENAPSYTENIQIPALDIEHLENEQFKKMLAENENVKKEVDALITAYAKTAANNVQSKATTSLENTSDTSIYLFLVLLFLPAALILAFIFRFLFGLSFALLKIAGAFHIRTKEVSKEYIA